MADLKLNGVSEKKLSELVMTAIGSASMCWKPRPTGIFLDTQAMVVGIKLVKGIKDTFFTEGG